MSTGPHKNWSAFKRERAYCPETLEWFLRNLKAPLGEVLESLEKEGRVQLRKSHDFPGFETLSTQGGMYPLDLAQGLKYEYRLFWPWDAPSKLFQLCKSFFDLSTFSHEETEDFYIAGHPYLLLKLRANTFQIKHWRGACENVDLFSPKEKKTYPAFFRFFQETFPLFPPESTETTQESPISSRRDALEFLKPYGCVVSVTKKRHIKKINDQTKIEISTINVANKMWKTVCIESTDLGQVATFKHIVDGQGALRSSYLHFLNELFFK